MGFIENTKQYFKEVRVEMNKVNWPTKKETTNYTIAVIIASAAIAVYLGFLDFVFNLGLNFFLFR